jgi:glyoxylase-like metal-dependent hydrolase (beta-lactamase superfamily II)
LKLFIHYCRFGFSNCYVLGSEYEEDPPRENNQSREAIIIDPGSMEEPILDFIESNEYILRGILITHDHRNHIHGLKTLRRIYNAGIYGINPVIRDYKANLVRDGEIVSIGRFWVEVISVPGHSADSAVYKIDHLLFTGDALSAGLVGRTASSYGSAVQMNALRSKILSLPGDYILFPGHGPPSSLEAERRFNEGILSYEARKTRRPSFKIEELL